MDQEPSTSAGKEQSRAQGLSFSVEFDEPKNRRMPKHLSQAKNKRKPELSEADIAEKQKLAEKRRKVKKASN